MRGASRLPTYVGRILIVVGFIMIVIAWDGAASLDFIQGQFPYLLSGAMPGLALIIVGAGLEYVQTVRQTTAERARQMAELNLGVIKLIGYVKETGGLIHGPDAEPIGSAEDETTRLAVLDNAGHAFDHPPAGAGAPAGTTTMAQSKTETKTVDPADSMVVAGRSSFHDPECHLVSGRDDMASMTRLQADAQGLSACRVCKP
jgi:hypothetical protein